MSDNITRDIAMRNAAMINVELDDPKIPDVKVTIKGYYFKEDTLREAAKEFTKLADDLVDFEENAGRREREALEEFRATRYGATMSVKFDEDGDLRLNIDDQIFDRDSGIQELIDHLKKVQEVLNKSR